MTNAESGFSRQTMEVFAGLKSVIVKFLLVGLSTGFTFLVLEFSIRLFFPQPINHYNFSLIQADGGADLVLGRSVSSRGERLKGYGPYIPNLSTNFGAVPVTINSRGWRDTDHSLDKPAKIFRTMVVGDSVTFGYGVPLDAMFSRVLERKLNGEGPQRHEVVTLGGAASNTYSQKNMIRQNVLIYNPDLVILAFNLNDILPNIVDKKVESRSSRHFIAKHIVRLRKTLDAAFGSNSHLYFLVREKIKILLRKIGIAAPAMVPLGAFNIESPYGSIAWRDTRQALLEIATQLKTDGVRFMLAILPVDMQISHEIADIYRREYGFVFADSLVNGKPQELIKDFADQHGILCVDLLPPFRETKQQLFFRIYGGSIDWNHPNSAGHKIIGEALKNSLDSVQATKLQRANEVVE